eukprot:COSAG01_NODE_3712_length_5770_cov_3.343502_2_plen_762_part_00
MAEEGTPPAVATWDPAAVAAWVLTLDGIDGVAAVAEAVAREEVDGDALLSYKGKLELKSDLGISGGKANKLWQAIGRLQGRGGGAGRSLAWATVRRFACFLSHNKAEAAAEARLAKDHLGRVLQAEVYLDSDNLLDLRQLLEGVRQSDVLVLFQTRNLLSRPWVILEIYTAITQQIPIVTVRVQGLGAAPYDFDDAQRFLDDFEAELERRNPGAGKMITDNGFDLSEVGDELRRVVPSIISKDYSPSASENVLHAQVQDLVLAMHEAAANPAPHGTAAVASGIRQHGRPDEPTDASEPEPELQLPGPTPAPAPAAAEQLFVVKATGEVLTLMQIFERGLTNSDCRSVADAAPDARAQLSGAMAGAQARVDVLGAGLATVGTALAELEGQRARLEGEIDAATAALLQRVGAAVQQLNAAVEQRQAELQRRLAAEHGQRRAALDGQLAQLQREHAGMLRLCTDAERTLGQDDLSVVRLLCDVRAQLTPGGTGDAIGPAADPAIIGALDIDAEAVEAVSAITAAVGAVSGFGAVGIQPPELRGYADPKPRYTQGQAIAPNAPQGLRLEPGRHGLAFAADAQLPPGLALDARTGVLSGTPTQAWTQVSAGGRAIRVSTTIRVSATNAAGRSEAPLVVTVEAPLPTCKWCKQPMPTDGSDRCALPLRRLTPPCPAAAASAPRKLPSHAPSRAGYFPVCVPTRRAALRLLLVGVRLTRARGGWLVAPMGVGSNPRLPMRPSAAAFDLLCSAAAFDLMTVCDREGVSL